MKAVINAFTSFINQYKLAKKFSSYGIEKNIDTDTRWEGDAFKFMLENTMAGLNEEPITLERYCGDDLITYNGYILHNQGKFNLNRCIAYKDVYFKSEIDCVKKKRANIFDLPRTIINTVQGDVERIVFEDTIISDITLDTPPYTAEQLMNFFNIPDYSNDGYFTEFISVGARIETLFDEVYYKQGYFDIQIIFVRIKSLNQYSNLWKPLGSMPGYYYYDNPTTVSFSPPIFNDIEGGYYYQAGRRFYYIQKEISNAIDFVNVANQIFQCTGLEVVSNFFGINNDNTNPINDVYNYASNNLQNLKVLQSFDIINADASQDSFGISGEYEIEKFIKDINTLFNTKIIYDEQANKLRWEHITYWQEKGLDMVSNNYQYEVSDEFTVNKDQINVERWQMAQPGGDNEFFESIIEYNNNRLEDGQNEKIYKCEYIITDMFTMLNNEKFKESPYYNLFFLLSTDGQTVIEFNKALSMHNIVANCHYYNRVSTKGFHDGKAKSFLGYSVGIEGEVKFSSSLKVFNKLNPGNSIKINRGTFLITEMQISEKDLITFKIKK